MTNYYWQLICKRYSISLHYALKEMPTRVHCRYITTCPQFFTHRSALQEPTPPTPTTNSRDWLRPRRRVCDRLPVRPSSPRQPHRGRGHGHSSVAAAGRCWPTPEQCRKRTPLARRRRVGSWPASYSCTPSSSWRHAGPRSICASILSCMYCNTCGCTCTSVGLHFALGRAITR